MHTTIKDVALEAGVSVGTVSKFLNGRPCSPKRRERIECAIEKLNYRLNPFARSTRTARSNCIGLLIEKSAGANSPLWLDGWLSSLLWALSGTSYRGMVFLVDSYDENFNPDVFANVVDGLITFGHFSEIFWEKMEKKSTLPLATYLEEVHYRFGWCFPVQMDDAMDLLAEKFYSAGHRNVGVICMPEQLSRRKGATFLQAFRKYHKKYNDSLLFVSDCRTSGSEQGTEITARLLEEHPEITGYFYTSDNIASGGVAMMMRKRMLIPEDISIASYDHTSWAQNFYPRLTGVGIDYRNVAVRLTSYLLAVLAGDRIRAENEKAQPIELKFFEGKSIGNINWSRK